MISKNKTRIKLKNALDIIDKQRKSINWPMVKFRHAILKVAENCRLITDVVWRFDIFKKYTICVLKFSSKEITLTYNYRDDKVQLDDPYSNFKDIFDVSLTSEKVKERQPKVKVIVKKKE